MKNIESIRRINKDLIKADGTIKSFHHQLLEYEYGIYGDDTPLIITADSNMLPIKKVMENPITINQNTIEKIRKKHDIPPQVLINFEEYIRNTTLVMESMTHKNALVAFIDQVDSEGRYIMLAIHLDQQQSEIRVNKVKSIYGRENFRNFIVNTYKSSCKIYPNKRTEPWIKSIGLQLPKEIIKVLSTTYSMRESEKSQQNKLSKLQEMKQLGTKSDKDANYQAKVVSR